MLKRTAAVGITILAAVAFFYLSDYALNATRMSRLPKNWSSVRDGVLYRSGQLRTDHLERMAKEVGLKTVVCLNLRDSAEEAAACERLGVAYRCFTMPGSGLGEPAGFHEFLRIVGDPKNQPVLVHCAAGAYRTGVAVASYRIVYEGWTFDDAFDEMRYSGCRIDGDEPLKDHVRKVIASVPADLRNAVAPGVAWKTDAKSSR